MKGVTAEVSCLGFGLYTFWWGIIDDQFQSTPKHTEMEHQFIEENTQLKEFYWHAKDGIMWKLRLWSWSDTGSTYFIESREADVLSIPSKLNPRPSGLMKGCGEFSCSFKKQRSPPPSSQANPTTDSCFILPSRLPCCHGYPPQIGGATLRSHSSITWLEMLTFFCLFNSTSLQLCILHRHRLVSWWLLMTWKHLGLTDF